MSSPANDRDLVGRELVTLHDETVVADVAAIGPLVDRVTQAVRTANAAAGKQEAVELALNEALTNAVVHGCGSDPRKTVRVVVARDHDGGLAIVVRDSGAGFDPATIPSPLQGDRIYSAGGRGLFLIRNLMDDVRFRDDGREIRMYVRP